MSSGRKYAGTVNKWGQIASKLTRNTSSYSLLDINVLYSFLILVMIHIEGDRSSADDLAFPPRYPLEGQYFVGVVR